MNSTKRLCLCLAALLCLQAVPRGMAEQEPQTEIVEAAEISERQEADSEDTSAAAKVSASDATAEEAAPEVKPIVPDEPGESADPTPAPTMQTAPESSAVPLPSASAEVSASPEPTAAASASALPEAAASAPASTEDPVTTACPSSSNSPVAMESPAVTENPDVSATLMATAAPTPEPTIVPDVSAEPVLGTTSAPNATEEPSSEAIVDPSVEPTVEPAVEPTPTPSPEATEAPEEIRIRRNPYSTWYGVKPSDEQGMAIPMVFQSDYRDPVCIIRGVPRSVSSSGCGAVSLSMVIAYLTGDTEQTPYTLFCDAYDAGKYHGDGWSHSTLSYYARQYGIKNKWISNDADAIIEALKEGKPVIAHMGSGIFTSSGHYVVLRGVTDDGLILLNDPASKSKCKKAFPIRTLLTQARTSSSFMVCWTEEMENAETPEPAVSPEPSRLPVTESEK